MYFNQQQQQPQQPLASEFRFDQYPRPQQQRPHAQAPQLPPYPTQYPLPGTAPPNQTTSSLQGALHSNQHSRTPSYNSNVSPHVSPTGPFGINPQQAYGANSGGGFPFEPPALSQGPFISPDGLNGAFAGDYSQGISGPSASKRPRPGPSHSHDSDGLYDDHHPASDLGHDDSKDDQKAKPSVTFRCLIHHYLISHRIRACARCKSLKVKCEVKHEGEPCKRCINGGHDCKIPGRKIRRVPPYVLCLLTISPILTAFQEA
jgi:Fungal Zn(2)-Cys(6) binuclear cluster domain